MAELRISNDLLTQLQGLAQQHGVSVEILLTDTLNNSEDTIPSVMHTESYEQLKLATEAAKLGIWVLDVATGHLEWNDQQLAIYGITRYQFENELDSWRNAVHPDDKDYAESRLNQAFAGESVFDVYFRIQRPDGEIRYINGAATPVLNDEGEVVKVIGNNQDITDMRKAQTILASQQKVLDAVSDAVIIIDPEYKILSWNKHAELMYGWAAEDVIGHLLPEIIPTRYHDTTPEQVLETFLKEEVWRGECIQTTKSGSEIHVWSSTSMLYDEQGELTGYIGVNRDITARKRAEAMQAEQQLLGMQLQQHREVASMRSEMLQTIIHEFRTPLSVILSSADLLSYYDTEMTSEDKQRHLAKLKNQVELLDSFLDDMSGFASVEQNFFKPQTDIVEFGAFCEDLVEDMRSITKGEQTIALTIAPMVSHLECDPRLLRLALSNLVTNAIKYSPAGSAIYFGVQANRTQIIITVTDEGIGIPEADQANIFTPFHRASNTQDYVGTGLGLSLVKEVVEKHGGHVAFTSTVNVGTTFTITLPVSQTLAEA